MGDPIKELYQALKSTNIFLDEEDLKAQLKASPKDVYGIVSSNKDVAGLFVDYDDFLSVTGLKKKDISTPSADGGEAGSFAGSFGELAGTIQRTNAEKVKDFIGRLEKPAMVKQGAPKVFDTPVRITAEDVQTEIERPQPFNLIMMAKAEQGDKGAELTLLEKEKPLLEDFTLKEVTGQVTDTDLQNLKGTYYGQKYLQQLFQKYNVLPNRKSGEEMADLLFAINKENAKTGYDMQNQVFEGIDNDILEFYKDKQGILYPENPSVATFTKSPLKSEDIVVPDLSSQQSISDAISQLQKSVSVVGKDGAVKDKEKIEEVIKLLRGKLYWMQSSTGVDPEINEFDSQIEKAVTRFNIDREKYETVKTEDFAKDDELNAAHFKQGLSYLKYSNPELYKNTVRTLVQRQYVADRDMEEIMLLGQEIINNKAFRLGTFDENFVNKQTYFDYTSKDTKKSDIAVKIGERLKELGYKQGAKYNPDLIKGVGDELGLNPGLVQELAEDEQIKWGGAIPKSGLGAAYVRGVDNVLESLSNSLDKFFGESPADSYLKSRKLDTDFGQKIVYVNNKNEVRTVNYLPSDRNNLLREIMEGTGKFVVQAAGAYVTGSPLGLLARTAGATTTAATGIRNLAGTYLSSYFQAYGTTYDEWLQKTGDEKTAAAAANFAGHLEGATELFLPDIVVADKISNVLRKSYGKDLLQVFKNGGNITALRSGLKPIIKNTINAVSRGSSILGKENAEELVNNLGNYVLETFLSPKTAAKKDLLKETVETVRATSIDMIVPAILGGVGGSSREFTRQSLDDAAVNYRQSKELLSKALANGDISDAAYEQALSTLTIHRSNLVTAPKTDAEGNKLSKAAQRRYAFEKTASWVLGQQAERQTDDVIRKPLEEKAKLAEKTREEIYNPDEKTKAQNNVELQIEAAEERMYNNISEIDQSDIDEKEKEDLIAKEEAAHVEEVKRIAEELLPKADIITEQTKSEDSLQPKAEKQLTIEEEINELENEKADIETAAAEDGLTQEDEDMIAEIDRRIDDLKRQKEEASTVLSRGDVEVTMSNWREAYQKADAYRKSDILRAIATVSTSDTELSDILDKLVKGAPNEGLVAWDVANNPNSSIETFEKAVSNKALRKSTTDENIQSLREKRFPSQNISNQNQQQNESKRQEKGQEELLGSDKQQAPDVVPGDNNSGGTAVSPAVSQYHQEWKPKSKRNKYKVTYDKNGKREVRIKGNGFKISEDHPAYNRILREHAAQYNYNVGQTTEAIPDKPQFNDKNEADIWLVENSQNPAEIAYAYSNMERQPVDMSSKEAAISREIGKVKRTSFNQFGDRNKVTFGMAKTYFNQQEGETLDNVAQRASRYGEGLDVTENDVVEFMLKFPYGVWPDSTVKSEAQRLAEDKFEELTGIPLNPGNGSMTVANRAAAQYMAAEREQVMEAINVEDANEVSDEEVLNTDALTGWKPVEGGSLFDNDKTENNDQAAQNPTAEAADGTNTGVEEGTGQRTGGAERGSSGASTGRDSGQEDGGEGQEGRDIEQGEEAGYTIEDFQKEIREIGPLDEFSEDDLRNMETPFMAATDNEAKLKAAQNVLAKAQRELNSAEDKIAKTQASQGGMFGQAAQGSMFAVNRDEAGEILGPLREAVKTARAEVDRLTAIVNDERRQADGQMSLFDAIQRQYPPATMKAFNKVQRAIESMFGGISGFKGVKVLTGEDFESAIAITGADTSFSFVGVYAMLVDARNSWGRAVEMRTNGESADAIFNETGWFYDDLDNKWKYELKREGFVYKPEISPNDFKQAYVKNLDEVINYPELFEAYPEFRNFKVYGAPYKDISGAGGNGRILVNTSDSKYEQRQTILHEIQHEIQRREGFARGANREDGVRKVDEISRQTAERIAGLQKLRDSAVQQEVAEIDALIEVEQDYLNYIESNKENLADYFYAMYAGEIEARNIEARTLPRNRRKNPLATRDEIIDGRINHVTVDFGSRFMAKPDGTVYGFLHNGTIYINGDHLNLNTPIHEAAHLFTRWAQANAPELYAAGQRLAGTSRAMLKIKADPFYQKQAQRMRDAGRSEADIEAMFRDEALAFNVGNRGQFIADNQKSAFREWLKKFWNKIKAFFGKRDTKLEKMSAEQFSNMSFDSFSQAMAERILSGERLEGGVQDTGTSFMATINSKGARLAQAVQKLLATGFTEAQVKQQLMSNGFSEMVADNIIANAKRLPKYKPLVKKAKGNIVATPGDQITFDGNIDNRATKAYKAAKRWAKKYFTVNKGLPEFVLPLAEKTRGTQNWAINQAYKTVKQLKEAAKKIGFTDWDAVDAALRGLKGLKFTQPLSGQTDIQLFDPVMANNNRPLTAPPATIPQVLLNLPAELRPIVLKMRAQIDGLSHELTVNGYISPEQALVFEENLGEYVTRTYALFNDKNWAKKLQKEHPEIINEAIQFIYEQGFNEIKQADPTMPDDDARKQAEVDARRKVLDILEGMDMEYNPTKTKTVKGRDNGILQRREDIPEPIRKLMGEYTDPGAAFMQTIARMATLRGQAKFLADIRDIGMGTMFWERDDPNRPDDANVELRSPASATWFPLGGLYTTKEVADFFNEMEYVRNAAVQFWMNFVGAVRWGKTVGSVVTQFKNWESNIGFSIMNGHFYPGESGDAWAYLWDQMKWWNGEKIESDLLTDASQLGLIGQNVGINELRDMFSSDGVAKMITAASTQNPSLLRRLKKSPKQVFEYLNKLYSASDDFFKLYGFVNERKILAKAMYGNDFESLSAEDKAAVNKEAAERVKNTYPTYDRVWEGAKYLSKNMPIFGNFLSFQAESIRVLLNSFQYAINDLKNPAMRSAGLRRIAGITTYLGSRYAILYAIAQVTGFGMKGLFGGDDDDKEQAMEDISRFTMPFMANSEKLVRNVGPGKYVVYDLMSIEPYGIWFKTINALRDGLPEGISEFFGPFMEKEMTFETYQKLAANESGRGGRIFDPNDPLGNKVKDGLAFAWQQLKPSTVGFIQRAIQRDDKFNEAMALMGARGYSLDVTNAFSIKVYKAEEEKAELVKDFFAAIKPLKDKAEIEKVVQEFKGKLIKVTKELAEDRLAALRLGADQEEIDERIYKASKKMIDVWGTDEIMLILGETDEAGFIFDKLGDREINKKNSNSVDSIKEGVKSVAR